MNTLKPLTPEEEELLQSATGTDKLAKRQQISREGSIGSELVGNINAAFTGRPLQFKDRSAEDAQNRADLARQHQFDEDTDPNSETARQYRAMVSKALPDLPKSMGDDYFNRLTPRAGATSLPFFREAWSGERARAKLKAEEEQRKQDRINKVGDTQDQHTWEEEQKRLDRESRERAAGLSAGQKATNNGFNNVSEMRKELNSNPVTKAAQDSAIAWGKIQTAAKDPSAAGDLALIFNFMKTLDPGSTVREGEFANAQNAGGVGDKIAAQYNNVMKGERLTPDQRLDFLRRAREAYSTHVGRYKQLAKQYGDLAERNGYSRGDVALDLGLDASPEVVTGKSGRKYRLRPDGNYELAEE